MTSKFQLTAEELYRLEEGLGIAGAEGVPDLGQSRLAFARVIEWRMLPAIMDRIQEKFLMKQSLTNEERAWYPFLFS